MKAREPFSITTTPPWSRTKRNRKFNIMSLDMPDTSPEHIRDEKEGGYSLHNERKE